MKKEKFSFVKWLTSRDIEKILSLLNYEILKKEDENGNFKKRILKTKDEEGRHIIVFCKDLEYAKNRSKINDAMKEVISQSPKLRNLMTNIFMTMAMFGAVNSDGFSKYNDIAILRFDDFFLTETLSLKSEEDQLENDRRLTKTYQQYMSQKFGRFYNSMKSAYYKKLHQEARKEEQSEQRNDEEQHRFTKNN